MPTPGIAEPLGRLAEFLVAPRSPCHHSTRRRRSARRLPGYPTAPAGELGRNAHACDRRRRRRHDAARDRAPARAVRRALIGINQGRLGFLTDIALRRNGSVLSAMLDGD